MIRLLDVRHKTVQFSIFNCIKTFGKGTVKKHTGVSLILVTSVSLILVTREVRVLKKSVSLQGKK